jgi:predicted cupin superfamily sugar epimerase
VNDLTNRELIRKKFKFEQFKMIEEGDNLESAPSDEENPNDEMFASFNLMNISKQDWNK